MKQTKTHAGCSDRDVHAPVKRQAHWMADVPHLTQQIPHCEIRNLEPGLGHKVFIGQNGTQTHECLFACLPGSSPGIGVGVQSAAQNRAHRAVARFVSQHSGTRLRQLQSCTCALSAAVFTLSRQG